MIPGSSPEEIRLSNGLPVVFHNFDGPVAASYWWIQTGSADERPKEAGFAHFLEHMHFKDTDAKSTGRASTGEMARAIESFGGDINAYTSFDQTVYHVTCASHHWEKVLKVFGKLGRPQRFLKEDFDREREVILEELRKNEDSPSRALFQELFSATYRSHPYGRPVIGYEKILNAASVGTLESFYRRQYVSGNMGLVLVGPYTETRKKALVKLLEELFGKKTLKKKPPVRGPRKAESELRSAPEVRLKPFDVSTPSLCLSFRVPDLQHADTPALDVAGSVLAMGEMSRLYQKLFYGASIVTEVGGGLYVPRDAGMLYFTADFEKLEALEPVLEGIFIELKRLRDEGATQDELARVVTNSESERYYAAQTADGIASRIGFMRYQIGDFSYDERYLEQLRATDSKRIQEVLAKYLDPRRMSAVLMHPEKQDAKGLDKLIASLIQKHLSPSPATKEKAAKKSAGKIADPSENLPEVIQLSSGARVLYRERPGSHLMSLHSAVLGGLRLEQSDPIRSPEQDLGASNLLAMTWSKGTVARTSQQITTLVEGAAANLDGFSGRNTVGVQAIGLARDWPKLSQLFGEVLLQPTFPNEELDLSKKVVEESIRSLEDHSSALCSRLFLETLYESHPYGKFSNGTLESVASLTPDVLKKLHRKWVQPERLVISVVGNVWRRSLDLWLKELDQQLLSIREQASPPRQPEAERVIRGPRWVERNLGREQVHLLVGGLGLTFHDRDRMAMRVLQTLLGGQSGRLFIELREKKSLAYSVAPLSVEGIEPGYVGTYIACSPSKKQEALDGIKKVLETLASKGPTPKEMKRAKEYYLGRRAMDMQGDSSLASYYTLEKIYDMPIRTEEETARLIEKVTAKEVQEVCRKYLVEAHQVTAAVG